MAEIAAQKFLYTKEFFHDQIASLGWTIGDYTYGKPAVMGEKQAKLHMGKFCSIAGGVKIFLGREHRTDWVTTYPFPALVRNTWTKAKGIKGHTKTKGDVTIGNDVWLATDSTILSGVSIGTGAVVATHALVTKDVPPYSVVAGVPAKIIRYRFEPEIIEKLLATKWWDRSIDDINNMMPFLLSGDAMAVINWLETHPV